MASENKVTYTEGSIVEYNNKKYYFDRYISKEYCLIILIEDDDIDLFKDEILNTSQIKQVLTKHLKPYKT